MVRQKKSLPCAEVAQLAEHSPEKAGVDSSILSLGTIFPPQDPKVYVVFINSFLKRAGPAT